MSIQLTNRVPLKSGHSEKYFTGIKDDPALHVKLTGSWEVVVGEQDTFVHILEYENYHGFDKTTALIRNSGVSFLQLDSET